MFIVQKRKLKAALGGLFKEELKAKYYFKKVFVVFTLLRKVKHSVLYVVDLCFPKGKIMNLFISCSHFLYIVNKSLPTVM